MKYLVSVREVHVAIMEVHADSKAEALEAVKEGDGEQVAVEYSYTLDQETWTVEEAK